MKSLLGCGIDDDSLYMNELGLVDEKHSPEEFGQVEGELDNYMAVDDDRSGDVKHGICRWVLLIQHSRPMLKIVKTFAYCKIVGLILNLLLFSWRLIFLITLKLSCFS